MKTDMKISFGNVKHFRQECIERNIHKVRHDYSVETKPAKLPVTRFKLILTASDGKDLLRLEHGFYRCFDVEVNEARTKKEVEERIQKVEEQLQKDFPPNYEISGRPDAYQFTLKRGVIEEV